MKVLLIKDVGGVGQRGTVKDVSDGYALNFLIPNGLAVQATPEKLKEHEAIIKKNETEKAHKDVAMQKLVRSLENSRIEIKTRATEKGGLFKSISQSDVMIALEGRTGGQLPLSAIILEHPIKSVGDHAVEIVYGGAKARMTIAVVAA